VSPTTNVDVRDEAAIGGARPHLANAPATVDEYAEVVPGSGPRASPTTNVDVRDEAAIGGVRPRLANAPATVDECTEVAPGSGMRSP
jgi:hypothetical protein